MYTMIVYREGMICSVSQRFLTMEPSWDILTGLIFRGRGGKLQGILAGIENGEDQVFVAQLLLLYPANWSTWPKRTQSLFTGTAGPHPPSQKPLTFLICLEVPPFPMARRLFCGLINSRRTITSQMPRHIFNPIFKISVMRNNSVFLYKGRLVFFT